MSKELCPRCGSPMVYQMPSVPSNTIWQSHIVDGAECRETVRLKKLLEICEKRWSRDTTRHKTRRSP